MSALSPAQLKHAFESSQSGRGFHLVGVEQLKAFAAYTQSSGAVVCNVEGFEVCGDSMFARLDLSIYQGGQDDQARPPSERIANSVQALAEILATIEQEGIDCVFQVWADEL